MSGTTNLMRQSILHFLSACFLLLDYACNLISVYVFRLIQKLEILIPLYLDLKYITCGQELSNSSVCAGIK